MIPKISVVMAVYNAEKYLRDSIDSILNQTFKNFELIVVNDGSTDNSLKIINSYNDERIVISNQQNSGVAEARNNGVKIANSRYIAIQDADDISISNRLEKQYNFFQRNPAYVLVGSNVEIITSEGEFIYNSDILMTNDELKEKIDDMSIFHPSIMLKKEAFHKAGEYPTYMYNIAEDLILIHRLSKIGNVANLQDRLLRYRIVPNSCTKRKNKQDIRLKEIISKAKRENKITDSDNDYLRNRLKYVRHSEVMRHYFLFLTKKYLWNNYQPKLARSNIIKSLKCKPFYFRAYFYFGLSFFPEKAIRTIYSFIKSIKN